MNFWTNSKMTPTTLLNKIIAGDIRPYFYCEHNGEKITLETEDAAFFIDCTPDIRITKEKGNYWQPPFTDIEVRGVELWGIEYGSATSIDALAIDATQKAQLETYLRHKIEEYANDCGGLDA